MIEKEFLSMIKDRFEVLKSQAENSIKQVSDEGLHWRPDDETNSIAILVKHLTGNMRSRWTNIFVEDGEKPYRNRPSEFDRKFEPSRGELLELWEEGWNYLFTTIDKVGPDDLMRSIYIRKEPHTVVQALLRQLAHYAVHVGQITFIAKQLSWKNWNSLSIPRDSEIFDFKNI